MARKLVREQKTTTPMEMLEKLVPTYVETKSMADDYKKQADEWNKQIKSSIKEISDESQKLEIAGYKVDFQKQERTSMDEDMLMEVFKKHKKMQFAKDMGIIKTKEYIDFDALENALYNGRISEKIVTDMQACEQTKIVEVLKVSKIKES